MMRHKKKLFILAWVVFLLGREFFLWIDQAPKLWADKNIVLIKADHLYQWGENPNRAPLMRSAWRSLFSVQQTQTLPISETGLSRLTIPTPDRAYRIFFLEKTLSKPDIIASTQSLEADFWVIQNSAFPDFLPAPREGILFLGAHKPGSKITQWARESNIPFVSIRETGGFLLEFSGENPTLWVRK